MSTTIKSVTSSRELSLTGMSSSESVMVSATKSHGEGVSVQVYVADLLAALRIESTLPAEHEPLAEYASKSVPRNAVVILRETLPEVTVNEYGTVTALGRSVGPGSTEGSLADYARDAVTAYLALAEWLDANPPKPPVDADLIGAVQSAYDDADKSRFFDAESFARSLAAAGVRIEAK